MSQAILDALTRIEQKLDLLLARKQATVKQTDEEWLAEMRAKPCYRHVQWEDELLKMQGWCTNNRRQMTRRFIENWVNKIPAPVTVSVKPNHPVMNKVTPRRPEGVPCPPELRDQLRQSIGKLGVAIPGVK